MSKYTKGPWEVAEGSEGTIACIRKGDFCHVAEAISCRHLLKEKWGLEGAIAEAKQAIAEAKGE